MKILLTGATGGIGSAIKEMLKEHEVIAVGRPDLYPEGDFDWVILAHGCLDETRVQETFEANVISHIQIAERTKAENIIFISSTAARGNDRFPVYAASKAALNIYCKSISSKRKCYTLCPGPTDTTMWRKLGLEGKAQSPKDVADAVKRIMVLGVYNSGDIITVRNGELS